VAWLATLPTTLPAETLTLQWPHPNHRANNNNNLMVNNELYFSLEPNFNGTLIFISALKDALCPGSFVLYSRDGEGAVGRIISQPAPGEVKINLFRSPVPGDNLTELTHPFADGCNEIVQTTEARVISVNAVYGLCFVFSDIDVLQKGVEVAGMRLVWLLRGRANENGVEAVFVPSFPCQCSGYFDFYTMRADVCHALWFDVIQCGASLLTKCLSRSALAQGTEFCYKQSPAVAFDAWKWDWLVKQLSFFFGRPLMIHSFRRAKKHITLRKGGLVVACSNSVSQSWIRFQAADQLAALKCIFGSWCLFGIRDKAPRVGTSLLITNTTLCNIVPTMAGNVEDVFNQRTHQFGVDLCFDGASFRIISRYKMVNGGAEDLMSFRSTPVRNPTRIQPVSEAELSRIGPNTFFRDDNGNLMVVNDVTRAHCQCRVLSTREILNLSIDYVRVRARTYRLGLTRR
jgi:hypothetical protein